MQPNWKRPKTLEGTSISIPTPAGTLHLTFNYDKNSLVEIIGKIGRSGSYAAMQLDIICRLVSILLQSSLSRKKIRKKIKQNLWDIPMGFPFEHGGEKYASYEDYIFKAVVWEIETKELQDEIG